MDIDNAVKSFVKCQSCGYVVSWHSVTQLLSLLLSGDKFTCPGCGKVLDFVALYLCSRKLGDYCNDCEFRFRCFAR